ncbi:MAG: hypothetical protein LBD49_03695 [Oscillospiraceae bacterium]|jgi:hypothetical protein|nr:hypothetical protein [Oscillospiraceae bacterium]
MKSLLKNDYAYSLSLIARRVVHLDDGVSYTVYGARLTLPCGKVAFERDFSFNGASLLRRLRLISERCVPYYQVEDMLNDYVRGG